MTILTGFPAGSILTQLSAATQDASVNARWAPNETPQRNPDLLGSVDSKTPWLRPRHSVHSWKDEKDSQARLYIPFPTETAYNQYLSLIPRESQPLAELLAVRREKQKSRTSPRLGYLDFILTQAQEAYAEKAQVHEVGGDGFIAYFFGQRAPVWTYSGALLNTLYDDWYQAFHLLYRDVLRGTRLADLGLTVRLTYAERTVVGSIMNFNTSLSAGAEQAAPFNFQVLAHQVIYHQADVTGGQARPGTAGRAIARELDSITQLETTSTVVSAQGVAAHLKEVATRNVLNEPEDFDVNEDLDQPQFSVIGNVIGKANDLAEQKATALLISQEQAKWNAESPTTTPAGTPPPIWNDP